MSWRIIPLKFYSCNTVWFGQKKPIKVRFFRLLNALMKVHPILMPFLKPQGQDIQILHHGSVSWKRTPPYFLAQTLYTLDKKSPSKWTFEWLGVNLPNSSCHIETKCQFFFKLYITLQCHERQLFCPFSAETLYDLDKSSPSKCKISDFWLLTWNFTKFVLSLAPFVESI